LPQSLYLFGEFLEAVEQHENNETITHSGIKGEAKAPRQCLTVGIMMLLINAYLVKTTHALEQVRRMADDNAKSHKNYARAKVEMMKQNRATPVLAQAAPVVVT
jgi:hypothetical protein